MSSFPQQHRYSLEILLLKHSGQYQQFVWHWPVDMQGSITLAEVLQELPNINEAELEQARAFNIELTQISQESVWRLKNFSDGTPFFHNDLLLSAGKSVRLLQGDDIKFGSIHCRISLVETSPFKNFIFDIDKQHIDLTTCNAHNTLDVQTVSTEYGNLESARQEALHLITSESFQESAAALTDLAHTHLIASSSDGETLELVHQQTVFSGLFIQSNSLDDLSRIFPRAVNFSDTPQDLIEHGDHLLEINDPIEQLHQHYLAKLQNPFLIQNDQLDPWQVQDVNLQQGQDDEFTLLLQCGNKGSIYELLTDHETTPRLLAHFDQLGETNILIPDNFESVMDLFAPDELKNTSSKRNPSGIPPLTRKEHHYMAIDSNMDSLNVTSKFSQDDKGEWK